MASRCVTASSERKRTKSANTVALSGAVPACLCRYQRCRKKLSALRISACLRSSSEPVLVAEPPPGISHAHDTRASGLRHMHEDSHRRPTRVQPDVSASRLCSLIKGAHSRAIRTGTSCTPALTGQLLAASAATAAWQHQLQQRWTPCMRLPSVHSWTWRRSWQGPCCTWTQALQRWSAPRLDCRFC